MFGPARRGVLQPAPKPATKSLLVSNNLESIAAAVPTHQSMWNVENLPNCQAILRQVAWPLAISSKVGEETICRASQTWGKALQLSLTSGKRPNEAVKTHRHQATSSTSVMCCAHDPKIQTKGSNT